MSLAESSRKDVTAAFAARRALTRVGAVPAAAAAPPACGDWSAGAALGLLDVRDFLGGREADDGAGAAAFFGESLRGVDADEPPPPTADVTAGAVW